MEKTTGTAKVTMEAFGEKFEQTGAAVIAFVIKPEEREEATMTMAVGGSSIRDIIAAAANGVPSLLKQMCRDNYDAYKAGELFIEMFREYMRDDNPARTQVQRSEIVEAKETREET